MSGALFLASLLAATAAAAGGCTREDADMSSNGGPAAVVPPARDGNVAIAEELEAARRAGTVAAYDLFIARHPGHPFIPLAEEERRKLAERPQRRR